MLHLLNWRPSSQPVVNPQVQPKNDSGHSLRKIAIVATTALTTLSIARVLLAKKKANASRQLPEQTVQIQQTSQMNQQQITRRSPGPEAESSLETQQNGPESNSNRVVTFARGENSPHMRAKSQERLGTRNIINLPKNDKDVLPTAVIDSSKSADLMTTENVSPPTSPRHSISSERSQEVTAQN